MKKSDLEAAFDFQLRALAPDLPKPEPNFKFHPDRGWRIDRAWPEHKVAVEIEGGSWGRRVVCHNCKEVVRARKGDGSPGREIRIGGRHSRAGAGYQKDIEKYNQIGLGDWIFLRYTNENIIANPFEMVQEIRQAIESRAYRVSMIEKLNERQVDVLYLIAAGFRTSEIANRLGIKDTAVRKHIQVMCDKLCVHNRAAAVARGIAWGMIEVGKIPWTGPANEVFAE